jgi:hypothetical protein
VAGDDETAGEGEVVNELPGRVTSNQRCRFLLLVSPVSMGSSPSRLELTSCRSTGSFPRLRR